MCSPSDAKRWQLFCGYGYGTNSGYEYHGIAPAQGSGYLVRMMVQYREGADHFHFMWDVGANGNFVEVCDDKCVQFNHGYPMGETGRRGGVATGGLRPSLAPEVPSLPPVHPGGMGRQHDGVSRGRQH